MTKRKKSRKSQNHRGSGIIWMLFGLSIGLVVAAAVYITDRREPPAETAVTPTSTRTVNVVPDDENAEPVAPPPENRFTFYDILESFEVVVPEVESEAAPARTAVAVEEAGSYVLQAGSFKDTVDAERRKANLALLGVESRLQRVSIDEDVYHRVRIGPTSDLNELNKVRRQLWEADMDVLLIRLPN